MYGNWFSELVYVRGAISYGDIRWVDDSATDDLFSKRTNLTYARVYGKGLVTAHELEQKSGPGAICFLTDNAAQLFRATEPSAVLDGHTPMLCWATKQQAEGFEGYARNRLERTEKDSVEWRHANATNYFWSLVVANEKFLPASYAIQ